MKWVIAVAVSLVCSGAWAELSIEERDSFRQMGSCAGLYFTRGPSFDMSTDEGFNAYKLNFSREESLYEKAQLRSKGLVAADAFQAGYEFNSLKSGVISVHREKARESGQAQADKWALAKIIDEGCEQI